MNSRSITHRYEDPLALIWIACAEQVGFKVSRTSDAYATYDGNGTLLIGQADQLDPDDHLAQMILHELCHALVQGPSGERLTDWGLFNQGPVSDPWREHAALRVQAWLAASVGLRAFFAPTTDYRDRFWIHLGEDPLGAVCLPGGLEDRSRTAAIHAIHRASLPRWKPALEAALLATQRVAQLVLQIKAQGADDPTSKPAMRSLWHLVEARTLPHASGQSWIANWTASRTCMECAWSFSVGRALRCRRNPGISFASDSMACARFEDKAQLDCETCGACCREAFDTVELLPDDRPVWRYPEWVIKVDDRLKLRRLGGSCIALKSAEGSSSPSYRCSIYRERPQTCRGFKAGGEACLEARQRLAISV